MSIHRQDRRPMRARLVCSRRPSPGEDVMPIKGNRNAECRMRNAELWCPLCGQISIISEGNTFILHSSLCIHSPILINGVLINESTNYLLAELIR